MFGISPFRRLPRAADICETLAHRRRAPIVPAMSLLFTILVPLLLLAILAVLGTGIVQMFRGSDPRRSNKLMQYRVILQFGLLMLMGLFMLVFQR
jgi:hypothetical protein